jgi:hypothetical protein
LLVWSTGDQPFAIGKAFGPAFQLGDQPAAPQP